MLVASSVGASALVTLCSVTATVLILRELPHAEAGRYAILVELLYGIGLLGSLGQNVLHARLYHQAASADADWRADLRLTAAFTMPAVFLSVLAIARPYELTIFEIVFLTVGAELFILTNWLSAVLSQQRSYAWGSALLRLPNGLLILPAVFMAVSHTGIGLDFFLISLLIFLAFAVVLGAVLLAGRLKQGGRRTTLRQRFSGLIFVIGTVALLIPQRGLIMIAGAIIDPGQVAALAALIVLLRIFDLIGEPSGRVFATEVARHPHRVGLGLIAAPWLLAGIISTVLIIAIPPLAHHFYSGRYDSALPMLPWLVAAAALRFVEVVPRGFLAYLAPAKMLNRFVAAQCTSAVIGIALMVKYTEKFGLPGAVWITVLIAAASVTISYIFLGKVRRLLRKDAASVGTGESLPVESF